MPTTTNIVDGYYRDAFDFNALKNDGIVAIIHKATEGSTFKDPKYRARKQEVKGLGLLWGAFHFTNSSDWEDQVNFFLDTVEPEADDLIAWDWEPPKHGAPMSIGHVRDSVELIQQKLGRYPVLYGGALLREQVGNSNDQVLKNCPLWYARYRSVPLGIPPNT
jgi:lysozyme